jgi:divalent metal cation (Fe/Co/Zn/Cd) transporter
LVRQTAARHNLSIHGVRLFDLGDAQRLEMHVEVSDSLSVSEAHEIVTELENDLHHVLPQVDQVLTHIEPSSSLLEGQGAAMNEKLAVKAALDQIVDDLGVECEFHDLEVRSIGNELFASMHCYIEGDIEVASAHDITQDVENALRSKMPELARVLIHIEPRSTVSSSEK